MHSPEFARGPRRFSIPLSARVVIGVLLGTALGMVFRRDPYFFGLSNADLGDLGRLVIDLLKALAVPLIFFAILDAFCRTRVSAGRGARLIGICLVNVSVAFAIGLTLMNTLKPGEHWRGRMDQLSSVVQQEIGPVELPSTVSAPPSAAPPSTSAKPSGTEKPKPATLSPIENLKSYVPKSLVDPFAENSVITVVLLALLGGMAIRRVKDRQETEGVDSIRTVERFIEATYHVLIQILEWVVQAVPFAVFGLVAQVVGKYGIGVFRFLWVFLAVILLGLLIHSLVYYPLAAWLVGRKPPRVYLGRGADAILTGISCNSSLATVPVTLRCLQRMGVSEQSSRLAACVGTNLNNDGITLYEAMAALFLAQAIGMDLGIQQQGVVVLASIMAGAGVAGIPEAGFVVLPLVLAAAGIPELVIIEALPLIMAVDWILARVRSGVNVMSDMLVAILLDAGVKVEPDIRGDAGAVTIDAAEDMTPNPDPSHALAGAPLIDTAPRGS